MRRQSWLKASGIKPDVQSRIADLSFEGQSLFSEKTLDLLAAEKGEKDMLQSVLPPPPAQKKVLPKKKGPFVPSSVLEAPLLPVRDSGSPRSGDALRGDPRSGALVEVPGAGAATQGRPQYDQGPK